MCNIVYSYEHKDEVTSVAGLIDLLGITKDHVAVYEEYLEDSIDDLLDGCLCPVRLKWTIEHAGWEYQKSDGDPTSVDITPPLEESRYGNFFIQTHMGIQQKKKPAVVPARRTAPIRSSTLRNTGLADAALDAATEMTDIAINAALSGSHYRSEEAPSESHDSGHDASYGGGGGYESGGGYDSGSSSDGGGGGCDGGCGGGD